MTTPPVVTVLPAAEALLEKAKRLFKQARDADHAQREREREDLRFQIPENQWDDTAKAQRRGGEVGGVVTPPRPMLSVSLLHQPMQLVQNQAAAAKLGVNVHPVSEKADDDLADVKQGLYRRIERDSNAEQARLWALDRAKQCGRGWYRVNTQWDEDGDDPFDQEIVIERILYQDSVYMDPSAQKPDCSDAEFAFVVTWLRREAFLRRFPMADPDLHGNDEFSDTEPDWVKDEDGEKAFLVAEFFYKEHEYEELEQNGRKRTMDRVTVKLCHVSGFQVLEEETWNGHHIPLIKVIGRELQPFDGERRWEGMVRPARDGQKLFNFALSTLVERMAMEPKTPFIGAEGQFEGHEVEWQQANIRNFPYLEYRTKTLDGQPIPPPQRAQIDQSGTSLALTAVQEGKSLVQSATAIYDPSLGEASKRKESGRAILALQSQADAGTSHYLQNMAMISMPYESKVVLDLMPAIYDRPGRVTYVLGGEDETEAVMLGVPFVRDPQTGRPTQAQPGQRGAKLYDLTQGKYSISVSIGKSFQTRLEQGAADMGEILSARPEMLPMIGDLYFRFRDFPGAKEIAERLKKIFDKQFPGLSDKEGEAPTPEQAQAKVQALEQQMQLMQAQLQAAIKQLETDQAKQQAMLQKAQMDSETKIAVAQIQQQETAKDDALKLTLEKLSQQFEEMQARLDRAQEMQIHREEMAHEAGLAAAKGMSTTWTREDGRESGQEQTDEQGQSSAPEAEA
jgi:hypothetical protein